MKLITLDTSLPYKWDADHIEVEIEPGAELWDIRALITPTHKKISQIIDGVDWFRYETGVHEKYARKLIYIGCVHAQFFGLDEYVEKAMKNYGPQDSWETDYVFIVADTGQMIELSWHDIHAIFDDDEAAAYVAAFNKKELDFVNGVV